jgi:quercetin dioxygenase-like cupin family protein
LQMVVPGSRCVIVSGLVALLSVMLGAQETSKPLVENERVRVTRVEVAKGGLLPEEKKLDVITVQLSAGETEFRDPPQMAKTESGGPGQVHYFVTRSQRSIKNVSKQPMSFIQVQFMDSPGKYVASQIPVTHYCNPGTKNQCVTEQYLFCTDRFCAETVTMDPGSVSTQHTHDADHMVIPTTDFTWREDALGKPSASHDLKAGEAYYFDPGVTHRLTNVGTTTAKMFVIQFK